MAPPQVPPHFVVKVVTGFDGWKCDWQHSMANPRKSPYRCKNLADISYAGRVIALFVPNFVAMATGVGRENVIGSIQWCSLENPSMGAKISQKSLTQAELKPTLFHLSLPWQRELVGGKCNWQHSMAHPRKPPIGAKISRQINPPWRDLHEILREESSRRRNQPCQILSQSDQGFWFCGGSNFWLSHKKEKSPLTQGLNYRSACDDVLLESVLGSILFLL